MAQAQTCRTQFDRTGAAHRRGRSRTRKRIRLRLRARARALGSCRVGGIQGFAAPPSGGHPRVGSSPARLHKELPRLGGGRLTSALGVRSQDQPPLPEPSVADWVPRLWRGLGVLDLLGRESSRQVKYHKHPIPERTRRPLRGCTALFFPHTRFLRNLVEPVSSPLDLYCVFEIKFREDLHRSPMMSSKIVP